MRYNTKLYKPNYCNLIIIIGINTEEEIGNAQVALGIETSYEIDQY